MPNKNYFSAMDGYGYRTIEFKGIITIKTKNKLEIFIINSNLLTIGPSDGVIQVNQAIDDL
jgi:hypothetical protein